MREVRSSLFFRKVSAGTSVCGHDAGYGQLHHARRGRTVELLVAQADYFRIAGADGVALLWQQEFDRAEIFEARDRLPADALAGSGVIQRERRIRMTKREQGGAPRLFPGGA